MVPRYEIHMVSMYQLLDVILCIRHTTYRGRLIFTPSQNHQIVEKTRFFDVISTNMIRYGFLLVFGTVPIRNRPVNDARNRSLSYLPKYRQKNGYLMNLD